MKSGKLRVKPKHKVQLKSWPTRIDPLYDSKDHYKKLLETQVAALTEYQSMLYASNRHALLIIFQAMDAAGKDSAIKHVMSGVNPQGCQVFSFKHPSAEELDHDFLWRTTRNLPERGRIGIFNRSYYEEVLVVRVHPELVRAERVPDGEISDAFWAHRYRSIVDSEDHLSRNGTRIVKFFLHVSREEQRQRFLKRIEQPEKHWKFSLDDIRERRFWKQYMQAYEECLGATSSKRAPWYIIPADDKENARLLIANVLLETLRDMQLAYPEIDAKQRRRLQQAKRELLAEQ